MTVQAHTQRGRALQGLQVAAARAIAAGENTKHACPNCQQTDIPLADVVAHVRECPPSLPRT